MFMSILIGQFVQIVARVVEGLAAVIVGYGAVVAFHRVIIQSILRRRPRVKFEHARIDLGRKLVIALEFELGADLLRMAIAPTWNHIGIVAAIIVLRTGLNYVLQWDIEHLEQRAHGARKRA